MFALKLPRWSRPVDQVQEARPGVRPAPADDGAALEVPAGPSGWSHAWHKSRFGGLVDRVQQAIVSTARTAPAVAAVTLALTFGAVGAQAQTVGAPLDAVVAAAAQVEAPSYTVQKNDNVHDIAAALGIDPQTILDLNDIPYPDLIHPRQVLQLPTDVSAARLAALRGDTPVRPQLREVSPQVEAPTTYTVRGGDNLTRISRRVGVSIETLARLNDLSPPYIIHPKHELRLREARPVDEPPVVQTEIAPLPTLEAPAMESPAVGVPAIDGPIVRTPPTGLDAEDDGTTPGPDDGSRPTPAGAENSATGNTEAVIRDPRLEVEHELGISHLSLEDQKIFTEAKPRLHWGMGGHAVGLVQAQLTRLGYPLGTVDEAFGNKTRSALRAFQAINGLEADGVAGADTWEALASATATPLPVNGEYPVQSVYRPYSADAYKLFLAAAADVGVPREWAIADSLHKLIDNESDGEVGRPNYTYGARADRPSQWASVHEELKRGRIRARSSATGIGQLLLSNVDRHYPSGRAGINVPIEEAAGMLSYIRERHRTPDQAWRNYNSAHEGY